MGRCSHSHGRVSQQFRYLNFNSTMLNSFSYAYYGIFTVGAMMRSHHLTQSSTSKILKLQRILPTTSLTWTTTTKNTSPTFGGSDTTKS